MKKRTLVLLVFLLAGAMLFATGAQEEEKAETGPAEISMSVWGMPWENKLYTDILIPKYEAANPDVKVAFHHFENYGDKLPMLFAGGEMPDVTRINAGTYTQWVDKGMYLPLDKYIDMPVDRGGVDRSDFIATMMDLCEVEGKTYAIPQDINFRGLMYNKTIFDKGGVAYPTYDWTWADLKTAAKKLDYIEGDDQFGYGSWWTQGCFRAFLGLAGGQIWNETLDEPLINSRAGVEALQLWRDLVGEKDPYLVQSTDASGAIGGIGADKYFEMGKRAMHVDGMWRPPSVTKNAPDLDFGMVPIPRKEKGVGNYFANHGCLFGVNANTKHPDQAWMLTRTLVSDEAGVLYWRQTWVGPPARYSDHADPEFKNLIGIPGVVPGLSTAQQYQERCQWVTDILAGKHAPPQAEWMQSKYNSELNDRLKDVIDVVLLTDRDIKTALDKAVEEINSYIDSQ
jgi:multiple sugar transport system substrate-binding protein